MDIHPSERCIVTAGEDRYAVHLTNNYVSVYSRYVVYTFSFVNVWRFSEGSTSTESEEKSDTTGLRVDLEMSRYQEDKLFTGVQFVQGAKSAIVFASYDNEKLTIMTQS